MSELSNVDVDLDRDGFLRSLLRELSGSLEEIVGIDEASGYISIVGQAMGQSIGDLYRRALRIDRLSGAQLSAVLVDLKRRIRGEFFVVEETDDRIVLGNRACPFGDKVRGRRSLCMMTSNVFGSIAAHGQGYAKVQLQNTIAAGDRECRVVVYLRPSDAADAAPGREYFGAAELED